MDYVPDYSLKPITFKRPHRPPAQPQHPTTTKRLQRRSDAHALSSLREAQHPQEAQARQLCSRSPRDPNASDPEKAVTRQQGLTHPQGAPRPTTAHGRTLPPSTAQPTPPIPRTPRAPIHKSPRHSNHQNESHASTNTFQPHSTRTRARLFRIPRTTNPL